jgi:hypothetical protein
MNKMTYKLKHCRWVPHRRLETQQQTRVTASKRFSDLFTALGLDGALSGRLRALVIDGIDCHGQAPITFSRCETFFTVWQTHDRLGLLKTCFRGVAAFKGPQTVDAGQLCELAAVLGTNHTRDQLNGASFTFACAAEILLGVHLPADASAYDGVLAKSSCSVA